MNFLGYPEKLPDRNTIWYFRERLSKTGNDSMVFNAIREIMAKRIRNMKVMNTENNSENVECAIDSTGFKCKCRLIFPQKW